MTLTPENAASGPDKAVSPAGYLTAFTGCYTTFSVIAFNTLVFLMIALFVLDRLLNVLAPPGATQVYSRAFVPDSYVATSPEEVTIIGQDFDKMGEQESFAYNPWTGFTAATFAGRLVNVGMAGYPSRLTLPPHPAYDGKELLVVWTFGGSTMFGWGVSDKQTLASHLQVGLQQKFPDFQVQVINYGQPYFVSSMEVALYTALLRIQPHPDIVLFLDGLNDVYWGTRNFSEPVFAERGRRGWDAERAPLYAPEDMPWLTFNPTFPLQRFVGYLRFRSGNAAVNDIQSRLETPARDDLAPRTIEIYRMNRDMARAISQQFLIEPYFFLQPLPAAIRGQSVFVFFYDALAGESYPDFYDISAPLEAEAAFPYVDYTHYSDAGSPIVAGRMVQVIALPADR